MKYVLAILLLLALSSSAQAFSSMGGATYNVSFALGDTREFIDAVSWRGWNLEGRWFHNDNLSFGLSWHWTTLHEQETGTWPVEGGHVTGGQFRRISTSPFLVNTHWHFVNTRDRYQKYIPYLGMGLGAYWIETRHEIGVFAFEDRNWHFGLAPEAGMFVNLKFETYLMVTLRYNYAFKSGSAESMQYVALMVGLAYLE
ncbi:MAG: hypothetical protein PVF95_00065 [bacterium]|jgi:hypothetical protein